MIPLILEMLLSGTAMILLVTALRAVMLHRLPKRVILLFWEIALLRLLIPFSIPAPCSVYTAFSQLPAAVTADTEQEPAPMPAPIREEPAQTEAPAQPLPAQTEAHAQPVPAQQPAAEVPPADPPAEPSAPAQPERTAPRLTLSQLIPVIWGVGTAVCLIGFGLAYALSLRRFRFGCLVREPAVAEIVAEQRFRRNVTVRTLEGLASPLTYGIIRPVILLPKGMALERTTELRLILTHECTHIRRMDCLRKAAAILAVSVYWFDPLVWVLFFLYNRDMELACDEAVVRHIPEDCRKTYALTLIGMLEQQSSFTPLYSHFSRNALEERIVAIMKTKKHTYVTTAVSCLLAAAIMGTLGTSAAAGVQESDTELLTDEAITLVPDVLDGYEVSPMNSDEFGRYYYDFEREFPHQGFLAVTTAEGLPTVVEPDNEDDPGYPVVMEFSEYFKKEPGYNDKLGVYTEWYADGFEALYETYGEDIRIYYVELDFDAPSRKRGIRLFAQLNENVIDIRMLTHRTRCYAYWDGTLRVELDADYIEAHQEAYDAVSYDLTEEIKALKVTDQEYRNWRKVYAAWLEAHPDCTGAEEQRFVQEAGISSSTEMMQTFFKKRAAFMEQFDPAFIRAVLPGVVNYHSTHTLFPSETGWRSLGDMNKDAKVNASDAAMILTAAAADGAGSTLSDMQKRYADVNGDGNVNASDAAILLQYAALVGSGAFEGTISDYLNA